MSGYRKEWPCCGDETYTEAWEPERCPFCELNDAKDRIAELETELEAAQAPASGEVEPVVYWVLYDSAADKKYIKKSLGDGSLAFFDTEAEARRAKTRHGKNVGYKRVEYYTHPPAKVPEDVQEIIEQRDVFKAQAAEYQKAYEALLTTPTPATTGEAEWPAMTDKFYEGLGWMHAECCAALDHGEDPRTFEIGDMVKRCIRDLTTPPQEQ